MARINWVGQSATPKSSQVANLRLMNGYAEVEESRQGKTATAIYGTPGLKLFCTLPGAGPVRALFTASNGRCFAVSAQQLCEINSSQAAVARGSLLTLQGPVDMDDNGTTLFLVDGANGYVLDFATNAFSFIGDPNFHGGNRIRFLDQYMIFNRPGTQQFQWTNVASTTIDGLNFASVEGSPDNLITLLVARRELWLFGTKSTEVWYDTGNLTTPFARIEGAFFQTGCAAAQTPARIGDTICWLSANDQGQGMVVKAEGYAAEPITTYAVAEAIQGYPVISDALGWGQQYENHLFYWLTFPSAGHTWVFDLSTQLWHERGFLLPTTGMFTRHRANCYTYAFTLHLVGDYVTNAVYSLDNATYTDNGQPLLFEAIMPPFFDVDVLHWVSQTYLQVDAEVGVGLDGGVIPGTDPKMVLQLSKSGPELWGVERPRTMGKIGKQRTRVQWRRLGASRDRRCRLRISDPVKRVVLGVVTDIEVLES